MQDGKAFVLLIGLATLAFAVVLLPFLGAVFWAIVLTLIFHPLFERIKARMRRHPTVAALITLGIVIVSVVLPLLLLTVAIVHEATVLLGALQADEAALRPLFERAFAILPQWLAGLLAWVGFTDLGAVQISAAEAVRGWLGVIGPRVVSIGQSTVGLFVSLFAMLYLTFFLLRDGQVLLAHLKPALPFRPALRDALLARFAMVVRATVKGDVLVAMMQGGLGGLAFWALGIHATILWTVLMSVLSLLPLFGAALVWFPFALYLISTGAVGQGLALMVYGAFVIGLVDNFLRPLLIGQATKMPEFVVLLSTLGGIATFGMQGFITGPVVAAMFLAVWTTYLGRDQV